ncbi:unnamed protein product [Adineta steineri]|uniref:Uncharacterized protein n=1 Tax=Adineta steineri TaxID=433720 RepID=A0A819GU38_9BILA|nr:unnamed protein product [Adineta steineri]CAF3885107.1 unnamed protein product [Adineta steineri]
MESPGVPIRLGSIVMLIKYGMERAEMVTSNKKACASLVDDLTTIHDILSSTNEEEKQKAENHRLQLVMNRLYRITTRANVLFDRCASGKTTIKIRNFLQATSIKGELHRLQSEIPKTLGMLCLVFHVKQMSAYSRGGVALPPVDETVFSEEEEQDLEPAEEYYVDDDG